MALKKYTKTVVVTLTDASTVTFDGADGYAAYEALMNDGKIVADGKIIPYHAVVKATFTNGAVDAVAVQDNMCVTE